MRGPVQLLLVVLALAATAAACGGGDDVRGASRPAAAPLPGDGRPTVRLGTKNFTEQYVLGELYAQALRAQGYTVELKSDIGATEVTHRALTSGSIDLYPEYTGTILGVIAGDTRLPRTGAATYRRAQTFEQGNDLTLLDRTPFEDRDAIAVAESYARRNDLRTISDLRPLGTRVTVGGSPEFRARYQGYRGLRDVYRLDARYTSLPIGQVYPGLRDGTIQAGSAFTTDGELASDDLRLLADDRALFGSQHLAPLVRDAVLERQGPDFARTLDRVSARLTTPVMQRLNARAGADDGDPAAVARAFLRSQDLLRPLR